MLVLVADSDNELLGLIARFFAAKGHVATVAGDGLECLASMRKAIPDVVVIDSELRWGGCDGVLEWMRSSPRLADVPVVLVADYLDEVDWASSPSVVTSLRKPFRLADLCDRVEQAKRERSSVERVASTGKAAIPTCFRQLCFDCGRPFSVPVQTLGMSAACPRCGAVTNAAGTDQGDIAHAQVRRTASMREASMKRRRRPARD